MKQQSAKIRKRIPIRRRFLTTVLLTTIISILAVSITGYLCISWIRSAGEQTLSQQLVSNLKTLMEEKVDTVDARLDSYQKYVELTAATVENMFENEDEMISQGRIFGPPQNTREYALTRGVASKNLHASDLHNEILFYSNIEKLWEPMAKENKDLVSTIYLGTINGLLVSYDRYSYLSCPPEGEELVYDYFSSDWYKQGMKAKGAFYTSVYMDSQGRGLTLTVGSPVRDQTGKNVGVTCMDFDLSELYQQLLSSGVGEGTSIFALDQEGAIIAPDSDKLDVQAYTGLSQAELEELKTSPDGFLKKDKDIYICEPIKHLNWTVCARIPKEAVYDNIHAADRSIWNAALVFFLLVVLILLITLFAVNKSVKSVIKPLELLEQDIKIITDGNLDYRATVYRNDEIGDITSGMNAMVDRLNFTLKELMSSQQQADAMSRLATLDSLTGVKNKTAFDRASENLEEGLRRGEKEFGFVLVDLNNLKLINDNYGHDKGDVAIKKLCRIICVIFNHSPVYRVGGDEFIVILLNEDYRNIDTLMAAYQEKIREVTEDSSAEPWERVSAAIGYALYDEKLDSGTDSLFSRADKEMYINKKHMKDN